MLATTHKKLASLFWLIFLFVFVLINVKIFERNISLFNDLLWPLIALAITRISSLIPDIDTPYSKIGRVIYFESLQPHRGPTHSLTALAVAAITTLPIILITYKFIWLWLAIIVGYASHIIGDMFTNKGVCLFYPINKERIVPYSFFLTGSDTEKTFAVALDVFCLIVIVLLFNII